MEDTGLLAVLAAAGGLPGTYLSYTRGAKGEARYVRAVETLHALELLPTEIRVVGEADSEQWETFDVGGVRFSGPFDCLAATSLRAGLVPAIERLAAVNVDRAHDAVEAALAAPSRPLHVVGDSNVVPLTGRRQGQGGDAA